MRSPLTPEAELHAIEQHNNERQVLFGNEAFAIGVMQAVSGGALLGAVSQASSFLALVGAQALAGFITLAALGLATAVVSAYCRHEYKKWDIKAAASKGKEAERRSILSSRHLIAMRSLMLASVCSSIAAIAFLVLALWLNVSLWR